MPITGGTWKVGAKWSTTVISDATHLDSRVDSEESRGAYGGALIAESIFNPEDAKLIAAAPKLAEALREAAGALAALIEERPMLAAKVAGTTTLGNHLATARAALAAAGITAP
jgi:electron transfer flavoprotein alpha subunit